MNTEYTTRPYPGTQAAKDVETGVIREHPLPVPTNNSIIQADLAAIKKALERQ